LWASALLALCSVAAFVPAQNTVNGNSFALRSSGAAAGMDWVLSNNGYVGTYLTLEAAGPVTLTINAAGATDDATAPRLNAVINDFATGWNVAAGFNNYTATFDLPAGTHFLRLEFNNDIPTANRTLTLRALEMSGAALSNTNSNANALAAAKTYIENYRRGAATVRVLNAAPGAEVNVKLTRHAFNFGGITSGFTTFPDLADNPPAGSPAAHYQQLVNRVFNTLVPSNGGKWVYNEAQPDIVTMDGIDNFLNYAERHHKRARMHNLIWDTNQQPTWVQTLITQAAAGDAQAKTLLRRQISERIDYYVRQRGQRYVELDVANETLHQRRYWQIFGAQGLAEIYNEVADALSAAGSNALTLLNEYNVLQFSSDPVNGGGDAYANWYRNHVDEIRNAGGKVGAIGVQYYADVRTSAQLGSAVHSPARILQAFQNLAVTGLPLALTEFNVQINGTATWDWPFATQIMEETMRLAFGTPNVTGMLFWRLRATTADSFGLVDNDWQPTLAGRRYDELMAEWDTNLTTTVGADGTINFTGFYGDYLVTVNGQPWPLTLVKGQTAYLVGGYLAPPRKPSPPREFPFRP
jgi:GH35 family endo-1,4-beta-xylanase